MFDNTYKGKKVVVTGHTGFKGAWLSLWLKSMGAEVFGISNEIYPDPSLYTVARVETQVQSFLEDIRNLENVKAIISSIKPDYLFHLAAQPIVKKAYDSPIDTFSTNVMGTANILEALRSLDNECVAVIITSDKCYKNVEWIWGYRETDTLGGDDPYSASKGAAELVINTYYHSYFKKEGKIKIASVRAGNVIGGGDWAANRIVPDCFRAWATNNKVTIRNPNSTRPWQHVLEPLSGYLRTGQLLTKPKKNSISGEAYNFGPPADQNFTVRELLQELAICWDKNNSNVLNIEPSAFAESGLLKLCIDKALFDMQWGPTLNFKETASFTCDWYKAFYLGKDTDMLAFTNEQINKYILMAQQKAIAWAQE